MKRISERDLKEYIQDFVADKITITMNGVISEKIKLKDAECRYSRRTGILRIKNNENYIRVNVVMSYKIQANEEDTILEIYLDNDMYIKIEK